MADKFPNSGELLHGQKFFLETGIVAKYTRQDHHDKKSETQYWGQPLIEIDPIDGHQNRVITWTPPTAALLAKSWSAQTTVNLDLPPTLESVAVVYNVQKNAGTSAPINENVVVPSGTVTTPYGSSAGTSGGLRFNPQVSAKSSAMVIADIQPVIRETYARNVPATRYTFYVENNTTLAQLLTRLTTLAGASVLAWPKFKPIARTFSVTGQEASISLSLDARHTDDWSGSNVAFAVEANKSVSFAGSLTNKMVRLPPCVNGAITISSASYSDSIGVSATVSLPTITGSGIAPSFGSYTHSDTSRTVAVTAGVTPTSIAATSVVIPTSGLYLFNVESTPDAWELNRITAIVVDFANV
jgi:hypothetical protein